MVAKSEVPSCVHPYFHVRDELAVQNGIIFRGERCIIPRAFRPSILNQIHSSHLGSEGCLRRSRECLYWPNMNAEVKDYIQKCDICRTYDSSNPSETLQSHDVPGHPWHKIGTDLFTINDQNYLITVDYFSNFWEVDHLRQDTTAKTVIKQLKAHFAHYGCPERVVSDNGPQYASAEFAAFAAQWDFEHTPASPAHPKSNGKAESAVKTAKKLLQKVHDSGGDPYLAMLDHRNTPSQDHYLSPAQCFLSRRTRMLLPTASSLLNPRTEDITEQQKQMRQAQQKQAKYYNRMAKDLPPLEEEEAVCIKPFIKGQKKWHKGRIVECLDNRSYDVAIEDGTILRRNRVHMKPDTGTSMPEDNNTDQMPNQDTCTDLPTTEATTAHTPPEPPTPLPTTPTTPQGRPKRVTKQPARYKDYVM